MRKFSFVKKILSASLVVVLTAGMIPLTSFGEPTNIDISGDIVSDVTMEENTNGTVATVSGDTNEKITVEKDTFESLDEKENTSKVDTKTDDAEVTEDSELEEDSNSVSDTQNREESDFNGEDSGEETNLNNSENENETITKESSEYPSEEKITNENSDESSSENKSSLSENDNPKQIFNEDDNNENDVENLDESSILEDGTLDMLGGELEEFSTGKFSGLSISESKFSKNGLNGDLSLSLNGVEADGLNSLGGGMSLMSTGNGGATTATLLNGTSKFNEAIKKLVNPSAFYLDQDITITEIKFVNTPFTSETELQSSGEKVYARLNGTVVEIYTTADVVYATNSSPLNHMFYGFAKLVSINLPKLSTAKLTSTQNMFCYCGALTSINIGDFDTSNVTDMSDMFSGCTSLTSLDISNFNTGKVIKMYRMFDECKSLVSLNLSNWNTGNVDEMWGMFDDCESLTTLNIGNFNTEKVTDLRVMFSGCKKLTSLDVSGFDTSNVTDMDFMFYRCESLTSLDISNFNTSNVTDMSHMFYRCESLTSLDVSNFNTGNVTDMDNMFSNCNNLTSIIGLSNFNTDKVTNMKSMFYCCTSLTSLDISNFNTSSVTNMDFMFYNCKSLTFLDISNFNTSNVTNMDFMFSGCKKLTSLDVSGFNTSNVTDMDFMFSNCESLTSLDISNFNTSNVTDMSDMFSGCKSLTSIIGLSNFNTDKVANMKSMFYCCTSLTSLDLNNFNTVNVTNMTNIFKGCKKLVSLNLSSFNTSNVTSMSGMFSSCESLASLDLSSFDTSKVTNMGYQDSYTDGMFSNCKALANLNISSFRTPLLTNAKNMFSNCYALTELDLSNFDFANVENAENLVSQDNNLTKIEAPKNISVGIQLYSPGSTGSRAWYLDDNEDLVADSKRTYSAMIESTSSHIYIRNDIEGFALPAYISVLKPGVDVNAVLSGLDVTNITWKTAAWDNVEESANIARDGDIPVYIRRVEKRGEASPIPGVAAKVAKTSNVSGTGVSNGNYDNSANVNTTVSFPGAGLLHVTLTYGTENNWDFVYVFSGEYTGTTNLRNKNPMPDGFVQKYCGSQTTVEFDVEGDAVTFTFQSDGSSNNYYGYFASVVPAEREAAGYVGELYTEADVVRFNEDCSGMFEELPLKRIGMFTGHSTLTVDTSTAKNVSSMFKNCSDLKTLDLSSFMMDDTSTVTDLLAGCEKLEEVKLCANNSGSAVAFPKAFVVDDDSNGKADSPTVYESVSSGTVSHRYIAVPPYTVTFETGGGSTVLPAKVASGHLLAKPADPTRAHFNFVNWYTSEDCLDGEEWDFENSAVNDDMTLYAKWEQTEFCVTFYNPMGVSSSTCYVTKNSVITGIDDAPDFGEMYNFVCWSKTRGENDPWDFSTPVTSDMALYAYANFTGTHVFCVEDWNGVFTDDIQYLGDVPRTNSGLDAINEYLSGNYTAEEFKAGEKDATGNLANLEGFQYGFIGEELSDISWQGVIDVEAPLDFEKDSVIIAPAYDKVFVDGAFFRGVLGTIDESLKTGNPVSEMTKRQQIESATMYVPNTFYISGEENIANLYRSMLSSKIKSVTYSDTKPENAIKLTVGEKISDFCWFGIDEEGNVSVYSERPLIATDFSGLFMGLANAEDLSLIEHIESLDLNGQPYLTAEKMSTIYEFCQSIKTIDLSDITLKDASGSSGNSLNIGCTAEGALSEKFIMAYAQYFLEKGNIARSFLSKADIARASYDAAVLISGDVLYEDWLDAEVSELGLSLNENASILDKEEAIGNVFYELVLQRLKADIGTERFELYQSLGIPDLKLSEIFMPQAAENSQISMRLTSVGSTERSGQGYCGLWAEDLDCNYVADDGGNVNGDFYPGKHYIRCMPYAYGEYVVENEGTDDAEVTFRAHEEGLYYADGEHTVPEISSDVLAEWTHDAGVPGLSCWSRFANIKTRYDFSQPADYAVVLFPIWGNENYTLTVPDEITWNTGYFDIEFNCDEDYIGSVTFTITSGNLDFSDRGCVISLYDDYDKTQEFTTVTFTKEMTKRVYLKKVPVSVEKAGNSVRYIEFDIAS